MTALDHQADHATPLIPHAFSNPVEVAGMALTYCPHELITGTCTMCAKNTDSRAASAFENPTVVRYDGTWREAEFPGTCWCGCEARIHVGDDIVLAPVDGQDVWCLQEHTRSTTGGW